MQAGKNYTCHLRAGQISVPEEHRFFENALYLRPGKRTQHLRGFPLLGSSLRYGKSLVGQLLVHLLLRGSEFTLHGRRSCSIGQGGPTRALMRPQVSTSKPYFDKILVGFNIFEDQASDLQNILNQIQLAPFKAALKIILPRPYC